MELHPDMLTTGQLTSHGSSSPHHFLNHTVIGSQYPEKGYDDFFVFDRTGEQARLHHLIFRLPSADHIQYRRSQILSRRPNFGTPTWSIKPSSQPQVNRPNPKSFSRGHRVASNFPFPLTVSRCMRRIDAIAHPRADRAIESGVQYYTNSMADGSGFKKKIHGGDGHDEKKPDGGYDKGCAAFLEFHEVSQTWMTRPTTSLTSRTLSPAVPLVPVPRSLAVWLRHIADIRGDIQQLSQDRCRIQIATPGITVRLYGIEWVSVYIILYTTRL